MHARSWIIMLVVKLVPRGVRPTVAEDQAVNVLRATLEVHAEHITRVMLHFADGTARDGHRTTVCHAKVTLAKALHVPSFHLEGHAPTMREAAELVGDAIAGTVRRALGAGKRRRGAERTAEQPEVPKAIYLRREAERPVSAHPPRGRHFHMTRHQSHATSAREGIETRASRVPEAPAGVEIRPSRTAVRKGANRSKWEGPPGTRTRGTARPARQNARG
jgi:hypothetical protein